MKPTDKSLWPLLKKDGLELQYFIYLLFWVYLAWEGFPSNLFSRIIHLVQVYRIVLIQGSILALLGGHVVEGVMTVPEKFPDIFVLWNLTVCWASFCVYWAWVMWGLWKDDVRVIVNQYLRKHSKVE